MNRSYTSDGANNSWSEMPLFLLLPPAWPAVHVHIHLDQLQITTMAVTTWPLHRNTVTTYVTLSFTTCSSLQQWPSLHGHYIVTRSQHMSH